MKIGVIGTINRDTIRLPDGTCKEAWGGILYNLITLSLLLGDTTQIIPLCHIGFDCYDEISGIMKKLKGIDTGLVQKVGKENNHCFLTYHPDGTKSEILRGGVPPIRPDQVDPLSACDIILVNFISGRDITPAALEKLGQKCSGIIYADIHSLTLGKHRDGSRYLRKPKNWPRPGIYFDFIQLNTIELMILTGGLSEKTKVEMLESRVNRLLISLKNSRRKNKKRIIVTDGERGCHLLYKHDLSMKYFNIPLASSAGSGDVTGCGDCFSAGFITGLSQGKSLNRCAAMGNEAAFRRVRQPELYRCLNHPSPNLF